MLKKKLISNQAVKRVSKRLRQFGADALIFFDRSCIFYFCGFYFDGAILLVTGKNEPVFIIDSMNASLAIDLLKGSDIAVVPAGISKLEVLKGILEQRKIRKVGFDPYSVCVALHDIIGKTLPGVEFYSEKKLTPVSSIITGVREIKCDREIDLISKAARKTIKIWQEVKEKITPGMTEVEIAGIIDAAVHMAGHKNSFPTIAAAGRNSAFPHAIPTRRKLKDNDHILVDFGLVYGGYCSDLTRTMYKGRIDRQIGQFRELVLEAHKIAIKMIAPGVKINRVLEAVKELFIVNKVDQYVLHGLGHGVGVDIHEAPFLRNGTKKTFKKGMVVTVEPGLYKAGVGGVRHEDMVLVTEKGCKVLSK